MWHHIVLHSSKYVTTPKINGPFDRYYDLMGSVSCDKNVLHIDSEFVDR